MEELNDKELKKRLLNVMVQCRDLCNKYHLDYSLVGGTLLGAIRHKGFIPWDDDVDIAMARPTYEKMIKIFSKKGVLPSNLKLMGFDIGNSIYPFIKIVDTNTKVVEQTSDEKMGVWIDIFPIDGLPSNSRKIKKIYKEANFLHSLLTLIPSKKEASTEIKGLIKPFAIFIAKNVLGYVRINKWCMQLCQSYSYDNCENVGCIIWGRAHEKEVMRKKDFENKIDVVFENEKFKAFSCYNYYLTNLYGNYMKLPPEKEREHHFSKAYVNEEENEK